jgi:hypothetical protein
MSPYSVDDIRNAYRRGELTHATATRALLALGIERPALFVPPPTHPIRVARSPLLANWRPM